VGRGDVAMRGRNPPCRFPWMIPASLTASSSKPSTTMTLTTTLTRRHADTSHVPTPHVPTPPVPPPPRQRRFSR
jgi:hypothetical protein